MSDFNPLDRANISTHRSSFDLSSKKLFTAKVGEILPCYWQIAIPGTKYRISSDWFTRTVPVNTAAYTRIKEYYDFYAVPLRLISRALPQAFTQLTDYMTSAASSSENTSVLTSVPKVSQSSISTFLQLANAGDQTNTRDDAGLPIVYGSCKLLDMLGYGSILSSSNSSKAAITQKYLGVDALGDADNPLVFDTSQIVNMLPLFTYQKIYFDFFSNSQWEKHLAYSYNVDYWSGTGDIPLSVNMLKLRYANYPKDYFMGMLPSSQYGSVAVLPSIVSSRGSSMVLAGTESSGQGSLSGISIVKNAPSQTSLAAANTSLNDRALYLNSDLSALSIRATEYLQRWKEVVQFSSKDYSDQMAAQFGIKAPEYMGNHAHYIGGWSSVININEVVNTNLDTDSSQASIAGKGVSSNSGHTLTYDCGAEHQVIMCVYHAVPMLDWNLTGQSPQLTVTAISDFPQPAFDQLGMQAVPALNLQNNPGRSVSGSLGYNLRYWQWKSNIDTVHAGFRAGAVYQSWAAPLDGWQVLTSSGAWSYQSMKVRPQQLNSIFVPQVDASNCSVAFDQLLCNVNFQVYAVQNLDRNGLPY
uniref:Major capsid protein n=1 Tax=Microviridae sp. ctfUi1 TaxID=2826740 RepID=A0A8S5R162_9VIRU|nr:MAG TPA: Major capsid protein [Microviridae sp. ctfUi1]